MNVFLSAVNKVLRGVYLKDKRRVWSSSNVQSFSLTNSVKMSSLMLGYFNSVVFVKFKRRDKFFYVFKVGGYSMILLQCRKIIWDFYNFSSFYFKLLLQKLRQANFTNKTKALRVFFVSGYQIQFLCYFSNFRFL